jgi:DNA-binding FrmR family transcriptional regulator
LIFSNVPIPIPIAPINLKDLIQIIRDFSTVPLDADTKKDIQEMTEELIKSHDTVVRSLTPFIGLNNDAKFSKTKFNDQYEQFKNVYYTKKGEVRTHCEIVKEDINKLLGEDNQPADSKRKGRLNRFYAMLRQHAKENSLQKLRNLKGQFHGADNQLADDMDNFLEQINSTLQNINNIANVKDKKTELKNFVDTIDPQLKSIKAELDGVRKALKSLRHT